MSIKDLKITDQNVQNTYVQSQPDRLTGTAQQNKAVFDAFPQLIRQRFNELLELLTAESGAGEIPVGPIEGVTAETVQQALEAIQQNLTAYINKIKAATGAAEVGVSTISGIQAKNVQKALEELRTAIDNIVSGIIPGGSITADMIVDGAIVQLGALLAVAAAAAYDPEGSYAVGDYCTHSGKLHKCNTAIPDGEAWNEEHWTETSVAAELAEVRASLSNKLDVMTGAAYCPDAYTAENGLLFLAPEGVGVNKTQNAPPDASWGVIQKLGAGVTRMLFALDCGARAWINSYNGTKWIGWSPIATATPPQEQNLMLSSGWKATAGGQAIFFKTQDGIVHVIMNIASSTAVSYGDTIATLPVGFRPEKQLKLPIVCKTSANIVKSGHLDVNTDGSIPIYDAVDGTESVKEMVVSPFSFPAN